MQKLKGQKYRFVCAHHHRTKKKHNEVASPREKNIVREHCHLP